MKKKIVTKLMALGISISILADVIPCNANEDYAVKESNISSFITAKDDLRCLKANENEVGYSIKVSKNKEYSCTFDMDNLEFCFEETITDNSGKAIKKNRTYTDAIVTKNGTLDACITLDGNEYMLSEFQKNGDLINSGSIIGGLIKAVDLYLTVADTAEKIKAISNYKYNKNLESKGKGVGRGYYITNQSETVKKNKMSGNYRFGFTKFKDVGCEVAAVYNATNALGMIERLSQTIYCFEAWSIEFAIGWGNLGSNPYEIPRYLKRKKISFHKYTSFSKLKKAALKKKNCKIIMSTWNKPVTSGIHTFYINKMDDNLFRSYNWNYRPSSIVQINLDAFNDGSGFIVGYIVWK